MDQLRQEFFKEKSNKPAQTVSTVKATHSEKDLFEILSVSKGVMDGYLYDTGTGTHDVHCISVKFKINGKEDMRIPFLYVYVYDKNKKLLDRLETAEIQKGVISKEIPLSTFVFKAGKTHILLFLHPVELHFKYFLVVVGNKKHVSIEMNPKSASIEDFEFEEKKQYLKQSGTP